MSDGGTSTKRRRRWRITGIVALVLVILFWPVWWISTKAITVSPGRATIIWLYDAIADHVLAHVDVPSDFELPVTVTSYPSGPSTIAVMGGRGHGLDCSLPWGASYVFSPQPDGAPVALRFRQACAFHDLCYRHGLATYGYQQNDCDELLQAHSFRICAYAFLRDKSIEDCQLDAKKITLAVRLFGSDAFQGWGSTTFYEFDALPIRSSHFSVARLLTRDASADAGARGLDIVRFEIDRVGLSTACIACGAQRKASGDITVPLEREGVFTSPQLVSGDTREKLAFATRTSVANTAVFLASGVWASGAQTVALSGKSDGGKNNKGSDLLGSTVYAFDIGGETAGADSIAFMTPTLQCAGNDDKIGLVTKQIGGARRCGIVEIDGAARLSDRYRLFQHALALDAKRNRAVLLKREHGDGVSFNTHANVVLVDISRESSRPHHGRILQRLGLKEMHEPAFLLPQNAPTLISLVAPGHTFSIAETPLDRDDAQPAQRDVVAAGKKLTLPQSWIDRPPLLLRDGATLRLLLTRLAIRQPDAEAPSNTQRARLEVAMLQRDADRDGTPLWRSIAAARCNVDYKIQEIDKKRICRTPHAMGTRLPTMLNRLRGSQTLAGDIRGNGGTDVAILDPCIGDRPIVLEWFEGDGKATWMPAAGSAHVKGKLSRDVGACQSLADAEMSSD